MRISRGPLIVGAIIVISLMLIVIVHKNKSIQDQEDNGGADNHIPSYEPFVMKTTPGLSNFTRDSLVVITTVFSPVGVVSPRHERYQAFSNYINKESGLRLITVEAIFPSLNQTEFQVTSPHNPNHIQIRSRSVYWMKENLINVVVKRLGKDPSVKYVTWLDADIRFDEENWVELLIQALEKYVVVQVFKFSIFLGEGGDVDYIYYSFAYKMAKFGESRKKWEWPFQPGYGWAIPISAFQAMGGLLDCSIVGGGDRHFAYALLNKLGNVRKLPATLHSYFEKKAKSLYGNLYSWMTNQTHKYESIYGYAPLTLVHAYHGPLKERNYAGRWDIVIRHEVMVEKDMRQREEGDGILEFAEGKEELQKDIIEYFTSRKEVTAVSNK